MKHPPPYLEKILSATTPKELETLGALLSHLQFIHIVENIEKELFPIEKLDPLLVGLPLEVFCMSIQSIKRSSLDVLAKNILSEPLLHHITVATNNCITTHALYDEEIDTIQHEITHFDRKTLTSSIIDNVLRKIGTITEYYKNTLEFTEKLLLLAWNSERPLLIQKLSRLKTESKDKLMNDFNGSESDASDLEELFFENLAQIYTSANLKEDDPAIDGLAALSIWYLQDYWEVGLLPEIEEEDLHPPENMSPDKKQEYRNKLFKEVEKNLSLHDLNTIKDLDMACIYSRQILKDYIEFRL
jgi:hypothetical protein